MRDAIREPHLLRGGAASGQRGLAPIAAQDFQIGLVEHVESPFDPRGSLLTREADGMFRMRLGSGADGGPGEPLPLLFTLVAERAA